MATKTKPGEQRPLSKNEKKILEKLLGRLLETIYETDFAPEEEERRQKLRPHYEALKKKQVELLLAEYLISEEGSFRMRFFSLLFFRQTAATDAPRLFIPFSFYLEFTRYKENCELIERLQKAGEKFGVKLIQEKERRNRYEITFG